MKIVLFLSTFLISISIQAQIPESAKLEFENYLTSVIEDDGGIGVSAAIRYGDDLWKGAFGMNTGTLDLTTDDELGIGSTTKTFVSAIILDMMEKGEINLSDKLVDFLPDYTNIDNSVNVKQLLNHTTGIFNYTEHPLFFTSMLTNQTKIYTPVEVLANFVNPASFEKGTKQEYSNTNYLLLGMIIKAVSGNEFQDEFHSRFNQSNEFPTVKLAPQELGWDEIGHLWLDATFTGSGPLVDFIATGNSLNSVFSSAHSAGAFVSTPEDVANWAYDLYTGQFFEPSTMDSLFTYDPLLLFGQIPYGLGVFEQELSCGGITTGHDGNIIYTSAMFYVPSLDLSISILTNDGGGNVNVASVADDLVCMLKTILVNNENEHLNSQIQILPNPSNGDFVLKLNELDFSNGIVEIYSIQGALILEKTLNSNESQLISLDGELKAGIYQARISLDNQFIVKTLIIE